MSLHADSQVLLGEKEKTARLEAQLEAAQLEKEQLKSASRIKELEQEIDILKADMRLSAGKPDGQAVQDLVVESTSSSYAVLRAELAQMQKQIAAKDKMIATKDAIIAQQGVKNYALLGNLRKYSESMTVFAQKVAKDIAAAKQHEAPEGLTFRITITDSNKSAEHEPRKTQCPRCQLLILTNLLSPFQSRHSRSSKATLELGLIHPHQDQYWRIFPADSASKPTAPSPLSCA